MCLYPHLGILLPWGVVLHVRDAAKRAEELHAWSCPIPCLIGRLAVDPSGWCVVKDVDGRCDHVALELPWYVLRLQQAVCHCGDRLILTLDNAILLW